MRFPRIIRLDDSDTRVYDKLAFPGEWAVPGSFVFVDVDTDSLSGKRREAFRHGFLGTTSFGWGTLVMVDEIGDPEYAVVVEGLVDHLLRHCGAPDRSAALIAARDEAEFAASLCSHEIHTLLAMERTLSGDRIVESFRVVRPATNVDHSTVRLWSIDDA